MLGGGSIDSAKSLANKTPTRGFGYWCWKPYIILKTLEQLENNDILLYADIGCTFHPKYREKLLDMISLVNQNEIMGFMMSYPEYQYTKADVFKHFDVLENKSITDTGQVAGGLIYMKKTPLSLEVINKWLDVFYNHFHLIDDSQSIVPNHKDFIENRHDQSVWSVLNKIYSLKNFDYHSHINESSPIFASRSKIFIQNMQSQPIDKVLLFCSRFFPNRAGRRRIREVFRIFNMPNDS